MIGRDRSDAADLAARAESMRGSLDAIERDAQLDALRSQLDSIPLDDRDREALRKLVEIVKDSPPTDSIAFAFGISDALTLRSYMIERCADIGENATDDQREAIMNALAYRDRAHRAAIAATGLDRAVAGSDQRLARIDRLAAISDRYRPRRVDRFERPRDGFDL